MITRSLILAMFASATAAFIMWGFAPPPPTAVTSPDAPQVVDIGQGPPIAAEPAPDRPEE